MGHDRISDRRRRAACRASTFLPDTGFVSGPDGVKLYYERIGSGAKTLIVPGRLFLARDLGPLAGRHTVILYDMRNRGRSSRVEDGALLTIQKDVEDLEAVRRHFKVEKFVPVGYSYLGFMVVLYAMAHENRVERLVQLGPVPRKFGTEYPASLRHRDSVPVIDSAAAARTRLAEQDGMGEGPPEGALRGGAARVLGETGRRSEPRCPAHGPLRHAQRVAREPRAPLRVHFGAVQKLDVPREAVAAGTSLRCSPSMAPGIGTRPMRQAASGR